MLRAVAILFLAGVPLVVAAPVPKSAQERDAIVRQFGTFNDPSKDAEFVTSGQKLTIRLPKPTLRNSFALTFPHTLREVSGDFVLRVKVSYDLPAKVPALGGGMCAAGGLLIWAGEENHVLFQRHHQPCGLFDGSTRWDTSFCIEYNRGVKSQHHQNTIGVKDAAPIHLRLTREKGVVSTAYSFDGQTWKDQQPGPMELPEKVMVGVYALQTTGTEAAVTFENFSVTPLAAEKPKK
jgi:hypothetical protein